jgi:hypothetical protein
MGVRLTLPPAGHAVGTPFPQGGLQFLKNELPHGFAFAIRLTFVPCVVSMTFHASQLLVRAVLHRPCRRQSAACLTCLERPFSLFLSVPFSDIPR